MSKLAKRVFNTTDKPDRAKTCNYYMTNISHPVIAALKRRYCTKKGISTIYPMSDQERTEFELWLFQPSVRRMVENMLDGS